LRFAPTPVQIGVGGSFNVSLIVDNATDIGAAPVQLVFDPKMVKLNDVSQGDYLTRGGVTPTFTKNIQNDAGSASIQLSRPAGAPTVSGSGTLLTFNFTALAAGATQITAPNITLRNSQFLVSVSGSPQVTVNVK
jgi:general secretion pathway protein D